MLGRKFKIASLLLVLTLVAAAETIPAGTHVTVPSATWKVALVLSGNPGPLHPISCRRDRCRAACGSIPIWCS